MSNFVQILGTPLDAPVFSHSVYGEDFYSFEILSRRLSGRTDITDATAIQRWTVGAEIPYEINIFMD